MLPALTRWADSRASTLVFLALVYLHFALDHWWKGSDFANVVKYVFLSYFPLLLAARALVGYVRRKPHWTRESWVRYLRLAVKPVIALALVLWLGSLIDSRAGIMGAPQSPTRVVWVLVIIVMMFWGAFGVIRAVEWLSKGEPSEQFTRTRWFQRRARAN